MALGQVVLLVYAALMVAGGYLGYRIAKSKPSLISGYVSGALLLIALGMSFGDAVKGYWAGTGIAGLLCVVFFVRWRKTKKLVPSAVFLGISLAVTIALAYFAVDAGAVSAAP